jgi:hypothetical protein
LIRLGIALAQRRPNLHGVDIVPTEPGSPAFAPPPVPLRWKRRRWLIALAAVAALAVLAALLALGLSRAAP